MDERKNEGRDASDVVSQRMASQPNQSFDCKQKSKDLALVLLALTCSSSF